MNKVIDFLIESGVFYLATNDNGKPDVRPMGIAIPYEEKIYFITAKPMNLNQQLQNDNKVSISAYSNDKFLRLYGEATLDDSEATVNTFINMDAKIAEMFPADVIAPYYLTNVSGAICSFDADPETFEF